MNSYLLWKEAWILTDQGLTSPEALLAEPQRYGTLDQGAPLQDAAILRLLVLMQGRDNRAHDLFGDRPFLQLPLALTQDLPDGGIHELTLCHATGSDVTLLSRTFDDAPPLVDFAEAARRTISYQLFALSRGRTSWKYSKDTPMSRTVTFHALGGDLRETLALNTPPELAAQPAFWEEDLDLTSWRDAPVCPPMETTLARLHAFPWRALSLIPTASGVRFIKLASGAEAVFEGGTEQPWPDPHVLGQQLPEKDWEKRGRYDRLRNPQTREVYGALVLALRSALAGDRLAPLSFRRARELGAAQVSATGIISRSGQPVVQNIPEAILPWPTVAEPEALAALDLVYQGYDAALKTLAGVLKNGGDKKATSTAYSSAAPSDYWQRVWASLSLALTGGASYAELQMQVKHAALNAVRGVCPFVERVKVTDTLDTSVPEAQP